MLGPSKVRHIFYFCAKGAISNTMLKHQGGSRTAGTHMAGDAWQGTGTWQQIKHYIMTQDEKVEY